MKQKQLNPFGLRINPELKRKVEESAHLHGRSMNSEIIYQLNRKYFPERFKQEEEEAA